MQKGWTKKASRTTKEAAELNDMVAEAKMMQVARNKRGKPAAAAAAAAGDAVGADKTPDLYLDTSMVCDTCGEEWQKVEGEEPSRVIQNCGVCLVASVCSQRCANLHHRKKSCIEQGKDPTTIARRYLWLATMKRCETPVHETPLDRAEATKERRAAAAAAKRAAAAATATKGTQAPAAAAAADAPRERGQKRAAPSDPEDTKVSKKSKEKHDSAAWPACVSTDAPCMQPGSETRRWFVSCADPECPSRRKAERRALLELTHKSTRDWLGSSSSIAEAKLHLAAFRSRLSIAGLRYDGDE